MKMEKNEGNVNQVKLALLLASMKVIGEVGPFMGQKGVISVGEMLASLPLRNTPPTAEDRERLDRLASQKAEELIDYINSQTQTGGGRGVMEALSETERGEGASA